MTDPTPGRVYSDEFYAAIDAQDFELACAIRDRDKAQKGRVQPRCAHCRREQAECQAGVTARELHVHTFSPTAQGNWFDCPLCEAAPARVSTPSGEPAAPVEA